MHERAMQQSDAKVNKSLDFMVDKCQLIPLFPGHAPFCVMIDSRGKKQFKAIVANKDQLTLSLEIFKTHPVLERQIFTQSNSWTPSLHKIGSNILLATSNEESIAVDTSFGKRKKDGTIIRTGEFVSLTISPASSPSLTRLTFFAKNNG